MKLIILSAFGGRLVADPIEWPDEPPYIRLPLSQSYRGGPWEIGKDAAPDFAFAMKIGLFEHSRKYKVLENKRTAAIYELVGL